MFGSIRYLRVVLIVVFALSCHAQKKQTIQTWWPDPQSGLMWTGDKVNKKIAVTHDQAANDCADLTWAGYTGWRLPKMEDFATAVDKGVAYRGEPGEKGSFQYDFDSPYPIYELSFNSWQVYLVWTDTPATPPGFFLVRRWELNRPWQAIKGIRRSVLAKAIQGYCVRPMEPELLALAKTAHASRPVNGLLQLQADNLLVRADAALHDDRFPEAASFAEQALALDQDSDRAHDDLGDALMYQGNWDKGIASYQAVQGDFHLSWAKQLKKSAAKDSNTLPAWLAIHHADVALADKRWTDAISAADQAIALEPAWYQPYVCIGQAEQEQSHWEAAIGAFERAAALDHNDLYASENLKAAKSSYKAAKKADTNSGNKQ